MTKIKELRNILEQLKGKKEQVEQNLNTAQSNLSSLEESLITHEKAKEVIREVGMETQQQLQYHISNLSSLALETVFDDPYQLKVEFAQKRNKTECELSFVRDDLKINPLEDSGVGAVDVASFALRVASWSMQSPRSRNVLILDEPFKHLKGIEENRKVLEMIREISRKMGLQIIMVSDERISREDIIASADKVFEVSIKNGKSIIKS